MAPIVPLLLAGGKLGLKLLPAIGAVAGAAPGLRRGNIGEALLGGGMGALTGGTSGGAIKGLTKGGMRMAGGMGAQNLLGTAAGQLGGLGAQKAVMGALTPQVLTKAARVGLPLAGIGAVAKVAGAGGGGGGGYNPYDTDTLVFDSKSNKVIMLFHSDKDSTDSIIAQSSARAEAKANEKIIDDLN